MNVLLDTHAFLWCFQGNEQLIAQAITHSLTVISQDKEFDADSIQRVWA